MWNYAVGSPTDAVITLDFAALDGGYILPAEADRVHPRQIDRMFISMVAPEYAYLDETAYTVPIEAWVEMTEIECTGHRTVSKSAT